MTFSERFHVYCGEDLLPLRGTIKALVYARVSTSDQALKYSLESQVERCSSRIQHKLHCADNEILVLIEPGESGDDPSRPALTELLRLAEEGLAKLVCVLHPDRLARDVALQNTIAGRLWAVGVDLEFVEFDLDPSNPESMLMFNIQGSISQYNKAKIVANAKRGRWMKVKNKQIPGLRRLYGYTFDKNRDILVTHPQEKQVFLSMVEWILHGKDGRPPLTLTETAKTLAEQGVPAPNGMRWYQATISRILKNKTYASGIFYIMRTETKQIHGDKVVLPRDAEEWVGIPVEPFIDMTIYDDLQTAIRMNGKRSKGRPSSQYLLKGLARCGRCGGALVGGVHSKTNHATYYYYSCANKARKYFHVGSGRSNDICRGRNFRADHVDAKIWSFVKTYVRLHESWLNRFSITQQFHLETDRKAKRVKELTRVIKKRRQARERYLDLFVYGQIRSQDELKIKLHPIDMEIERLEQEINKLGVLKQPFPMETANLRRRLLEDDFSFEQKQALVRIMIQKVILHDHQELEVYTLPEAWLDGTKEKEGNCACPHGK